MKAREKAAAVSSTQSASTARFEWTMINVNKAEQQGDAHLIRVGNSNNILIDAGSRELAEKSLIPLLTQRRITALGLVFISHAHMDHYGGLDALLDHDIGIGTLYFNLPEREKCERETPWGCDYRDVQRVRRRLESAGIELRRAKTGMKFPFGDRSQLEILFAYDGLSPRIDKADINDMSLVMKLSHGGFRMLFTGDLNEDVGGFLAAHSDNLAADIIKIPHHGIEPVTPELFFEKVAPRWGLVSTPAQFWRSEMSSRVRSWFVDRGIPVYVSGVLGNVSVSIENGELKIWPDLAETTDQT